MDERRDCDSNVLEHSIDDQEQMQGMSFLESKPAVQVKNKKKKKKKKNQKEKQQQQCDIEIPNESQDCFIGNIIDIENAKSTQPLENSRNKFVTQARNVASKHENEEKSGDSDVNVVPVALMASCTSLLLTDAYLNPKSALRGSYEKLGLGPRPKLHVRWAPGVWEPPRTTVSHTVKSYNVKKGSRHGGKSRSGHHDSRKQKRKKNKSDNNTMQNGKQKVVNITPRCMPEASNELPSNIELERSSSEEISIKPNHFECRELANNQMQLSLKGGVVDCFQYSSDSTCGISMINSFGVSTLPVGEAI